MPFSAHFRCHYFADIIFISPFRFFFRWLFSPCQHMLKQKKKKKKKKSEKKILPLRHFAIIAAIFRHFSLFRLFAAMPLMLSLILLPLLIFFAFRYFADYASALRWFSILFSFSFHAEPPFSPFFTAAAFAIFAADAADAAYYFRFRLLLMIFSFARWCRLRHAAALKLPVRWCFRLFRRRQIAPLLLFAADAASAVSLSLMLPSLLAAAFAVIFIRSNYY